MSLSTAEKSLRLLLTKDQAEANELAEFLDKQNRERQEVEKKIFAAADEKIAIEFDPLRDAAIVVWANEWHPGVLGIVASRLTHKYHRPTLVIGFDESGVGKVKAPLAVMVRLLLALFCSTTVPFRPETVPPTVYDVLELLPPPLL